MNAARHQLALALLAGHTFRSAARKLKRSERTLRRWAKEEEFRKELDAARTAAVAEGVLVLQGAMARAARRLLKDLNAGKVGDRTKVACALIDRALTGGQLLDLAAKLAELEALLKKRRKG
jgi:hypothetical protein